MTAARLPPAVRDLLRAAPDAAGADADLLARFAATRDEAAFGELVRRHGGAVWDVCRSVLGNRADADDAFQAVFLTLARRAARLRKPGSVGAWLHGVAVRVARKARVAAARRQQREAAAPPPPPAGAVDPSWAEVRAAVHEALAALPERYREPLVACYLRGLTQDDAAAELGLSHAAVKKRLERGRDRLRAVLTRRGFGPAVVLAVGATPAVAVPDHLLLTAPRLAAGVGPVPEAILRLVEGGGSMTFAKFGAVAALFAAVGVTLAAGGEQPARRPASTVPPQIEAKLKDLDARLKAAREPAVPTGLDGQWTVQLIETAGEPLYDAKVSDEFTPPPKFVFDGNRCQVQGVQVLFVRDFTFTLDPTQTPKAIDVTFIQGPKAGETFVGIYQIRENELRMCLRLQGTQLGRPKGYVTNSGRTLYTFILTRGEKAPGGEPKAPPPVPTAEAPFDRIVKSGNKLYFVLDRPPGESFEAGLAEFGKRTPLAARTADRQPERDLTVMFVRERGKAGGSGELAGFSRDRLREIALTPPEKRVEKLMEHAWVMGRVPTGATPVSPVPPPAPKVDALLPGLGPIPAAKTDDQVLSAAELAKLITGPNGNVTRAYGKEVEFTGTVVSVGKGVDGGTVPFVTVDGWAGKKDPFGQVYVHNVFPDRVGQVGDRVRVRGRVVQHGYGTLTLWCDRWSREEGPVKR